MDSNFFFRWLGDVLQSSCLSSFASITTRPAVGAWGISSLSCLISSLAWSKIETGSTGATYLGCLFSKSFQYSRWRSSGLYQLGPGVLGALAKLMKECLELGIEASSSYLVASRPVAGGDAWVSILIGLSWHRQPYPVYHLVNYGGEREGRLGAARRPWKPRLCCSPGSYT